MKIIHPF